LSTGLSDPRILGEPCEVHFAGFRSDTYRLQQAGWQLSMEQDLRMRTINLIMRFEPARLYMMARGQDFDYFRDTRGARPVFHIQHCSSNLTVQIMGTLASFAPVDATPAFVTSERKRIEDFAIFAPLQVRTEEILVDPKSVDECLALIKKMQAPELEAVRKRNAARARDPGSMEHGYLQRTNVHAQVITLAA
jgi:hypothetical protein